MKKALQLSIPTGGTLPAEYAADLHEALTETMKMAFSQQEMTLDERQTFAIHTLNGFIQQLGTTYPAATQAEREERAPEPPVPVKWVSLPIPANVDEKTLGNIAFWVVSDLLTVSRYIDADSLAGYNQRCAFMLSFSRALKENGFDERLG